MLTQEIREAAKRSVLCWMATVDAAGEPNVSPKEVWSILDDQHIVIANIASPQTSKNVVATGKACLSFIDVFVQKGFKVSGACREIVRSDLEFNHFAAPLVAVAEPRFPVRSVFVLKAAKAQAIVAPSYRLYPAEVTEASQRASAMRAYGVQPEDRGT